MIKHAKKIFIYLFFVSLFGFCIVMPSCSSENTPLVSQKDNFADELIEKNTLNVGVVPDHKPFEYIDGDTVSGLDIDVINMIANDLNLNVKLNFSTMDDIINDVEKGEKCDVAISDLQITEERQKRVLMSSPYYSIVDNGVEKKAGIAIGKNKTALSRSINKAIEVNKNNGNIQKIINKWL